MTIWLDRLPTKQQHQSLLLKQTLDEVAKGGMSIHSEFGITMQFIIRGLEEKKIPYRIDAVPTRGYRIVGDPTMLAFTRE